MVLTTPELHRWRMDILGAEDDELSDQQFNIRKVYHLIAHLLHREHHSAIKAIENISATNDVLPVIATECEVRLTEIQLAEDALEAGMLGLRHPVLSYLDAARSASGSKNQSRLQRQQIATMSAFVDVAQARLPEKCPSERAAIAYVITILEKLMDEPPTAEAIRNQMKRLDTEFADPREPETGRESVDQVLKMRLGRDYRSHREACREHFKSISQSMLEHEFSGQIARLLGPRSIRRLAGGSSG